MLDVIQPWYQTPISQLKWLITVVILTSAIIVTPQCTVAGRVEEYQFQNIRVQKEIVDRRVSSVEKDVNSLRERVEEAEANIGLQLEVIKRTDRDIETKMFTVSPKLMMQMAQHRADAERLKFIRERHINQQANPTINASPTNTINMKNREPKRVQNEIDTRN